MVGKKRVNIPVEAPGEPHSTNSFRVLFGYLERSFSRDPKGISEGVLKLIFPLPLLCLRRGSTKALPSEVTLRGRSVSLVTGSCWCSSTGFCRNPCYVECCINIPGKSITIHD